MRKFWLLIFYLISFGVLAIEPECKGSFINPVTDVDWKAMFPMHIAGAKVVSGRDDKSTKNPKKEVICRCSDRVPLIYGIPVGFWQPFRAIDVTRKPYCMVNLGGTKLNVGVKAPRGDIALASSANLGHGYQTAFYHVH